MPRKKMEPTYLTPEDVSMRLHSSIIRYKKQFYYTHAHGMKLKLFNLHTSNQDHTVDANSPDLDVSSPELGFINWDSGYLWFVYRIPYRKQKQGISHDNLGAISIQEHRTKSVSSDTFMSKAFLDMLEGNYPTYSEVLASKKSRAFCRNYALHFDKEEIKLLFNEAEIGLYEKDKGSFALSDTYNNSVTVMRLASLGVSLS